MEIAANLLDLLVCPACRGPVASLPGGSEIACAGCGRAYPVRDGIPVLLVEEAAGPSGSRP